MSEIPFDVDEEEKSPSAVAPPPQRIRKPPFGVRDAAMSSVAPGRVFPFHVAAPATGGPYVLPDPSPRNAALLLLHPEFNTAETRDAVRTRLLRAMPGCHISVDVGISGERIVGAERLLDRHMGDLARYAMVSDPVGIEGGAIDDDELFEVS